MNVPVGSRININMVAEDAGITSFGGNFGTLTVNRQYAYSYQYPWNYTWSDGYNWGLDTYSNAYDYVYGITTP